jgi:hypothetical protein
MTESFKILANFLVLKRTVCYILYNIKVNLETSCP